MPYQIDINHKKFDLEEIIQFYQKYPFKLVGTEDKPIYIRKSIQKEGRVIFSVELFGSNIEIILIKEGSSSFEIINDLPGLDTEQVNELIEVYSQRIESVPQNFLAFMFYLCKKYDDMLFDFNESNSIESFKELNLRMKDILYFKLSASINFQEPFDQIIEGSIWSEYRGTLKKQEFNSRLIKNFERLPDKLKSELDVNLTNNVFKAAKIYREKTGSSFKESIETMYTRKILLGLS